MRVRGGLSVTSAPREFWHGLPTSRPATRRRFRSGGFEKFNRWRSQLRGEKRERLKGQVLLPALNGLDVANPDIDSLRQLFLGELPSQSKLGDAPPDVLQEALGGDGFHPRNVGYAGALEPAILMTVYVSER